MTECRLVLAKAAADAGARIDAARPAHLGLIAPMAEAGDLILGLPLLDAEGSYRGSLMVVTAESVDRYLEAEPFRTGGIWASHEVHPFRVAPLPYHPIPAGPLSAVPTHSVAIARDGTDPAAPARRLSVREAHLARVAPAARNGTLLLGGAILAADGGGMTGSVAITAHPTIEAARHWWSSDPYVTGKVWQNVEWHGTRIAPLPYRSLPGAE